MEISLLSCLRYCCCFCCPLTVNICGISVYFEKPIQPYKIANKIQEKKHIDSLKNPQALNKLFLRLVSVEAACK